MDLSAPVPATQSENATQTLVELTAIEKIWLFPLKGREEDCGKVTNHAIGLGVCPRCVFRLLKVKDIKFYREDRLVRITPFCSPSWRCLAPRSNSDKSGLVLDA